MAVITLDEKNNCVCVLVEKSDLIHIKDGNMVEISTGLKHLSGKVWINDKIDTLVLRGERQ